MDTLPFCKRVERARIRLITARVSPMVELARWLLEKAHIPYREAAHVPVIHVLATRSAGGGNEVPVAITAEGTWSGARAFIHELDAKLPEAERTFRGSAEAKQRDIAFVDKLLDKLLKPVRRYVYYELLPSPDLIKPVAKDGAPPWETLIVDRAYPLWRRLMARALDFSPELIAKAPEDIDDAFELVAARLDSAPYLGGETPSNIDIVFSALAAPVVFPPQYGAKLPKLEELPPKFRRFIDEKRAHRAGQLVLRTYAHARGEPQVRLSERKVKRELLPQGLVRNGASLLARLKPRINIGKRVLVLNHSGVREVLDNDLAFTIGPVNGEKINAVCGGDFILGLDRSPKLAEERTAVYRALSEVDIGKLIVEARTDAVGLLDSARAGQQRIEIVNGYARLVAARSVFRLFGVRTPTESDLMRVARAIFHETFLNLGDDQAVKQRAVAAGEELAGWTNATIAERRSQLAMGGTEGDDFLGRLLQMGLDDDTVRRNVTGMLVGAIDTTASAVANIVAEILADPHLFEATKRTAFPTPATMDPGRPLERYLHFGGGLHRCAGLDLNVHQVPMLVAELMKRHSSKLSPLRFDGPFPDELVVALRRDR